MNCDRCDERAVIHQRYSGLHLCRDHFLRSVEKRTKREVRRYDVRGDVVVGLSGGKDSAATLHLLDEIFGEWRGTELKAVCVHEGISPYRDDGIEAAKEAAEEAEVTMEVVEMEEELGVRIEELEGDELTSCGYCGVFRRRLLNDAALDAGAEWLATGHNLDDEAQSTMMNAVRGDGFRLAIQDRVPRRMEGLVPRMKPLRKIPEKEVALYVRLKGLPAVTEECPHSEDSFRAEIRSTVNEMENRRPGTKHSLVSLPSSIREGLETESPEMGECDSCGHPTSGELCQTCRYMEGLDE